MTRTIDALVARASAADPGRLAVDDGAARLTHADLAAAVDRAARALAAEGAAEGEPVLVPVSGRAADLVALLAVQRAGAVAAPVHRTTPAAAVEALRTRLRARFAMEAAPRRIAPGGAARRLDGAGTVIFTSGSTGEPKGVVLSAERAADKLAMIGRELDWREGESSLVPLQLTFSFGQWAAWLTLARGGTVHLRGRPDAAELLALAPRVSRLPSAPTLLRRLAEAGGAPGFSGAILSGGEALPAPLADRLRAAFPNAALFDVYGLTETGTSDLFVKPGDPAAFAGTLGRPGEGIEIRLSPEGELRIRSPWRMLHYLDAPDLTERAMPDGWFRTGDLAEATPEGAIRLIGRAKDLVIRAGNKIAPLEVEAAFLAHPDVSAALAAGAPDPERGEALHLALVLRPGAETPPETLRAFAAERLDRWKLPDRLHFVAALPTGATGKADRAAFRRRLAETPA